MSLQVICRPSLEPCSVGEYQQVAVVSEPESTQCLIEDAGLDPPNFLPRATRRARRAIVIPGDWRPSVGQRQSYGRILHV